MDEAKRSQWEMTVKEGADRWNPNWDVTHINDFVQQLVGFGKGSNKRRRGTSSTEDTIKEALATTHNDVEMAKLRQRLWQERKRIRREKSETHFTHILHNLKSGGWGKKDMDGRKGSMTQLLMEDGTTTSDKTTMAEQATKYYSTLFDINADEQDWDRTANMHRYIHTEYDHFMQPGWYSRLPQATTDVKDNDAHNEEDQWDYAAVSINADMVSTAIRACKRGKMCARDGVVSEVWQALIDSEPRWSAAIAWEFNGRLQNSQAQTLSHAHRSMHVERFRIQIDRSRFGGLLALYT